MSKFATILIAHELLYVTFYTIKIKGEPQSEGESLPLFHQFINDHSSERFKKHLDVIKNLIRGMGNEHGARRERFRNEAYGGGEAVALPSYIEYTRKKCDLRLYCMWINENAVFLFGGGEKTALTAQECDNVRSHFLLANELTKAIDKAIRNRELKIAPNGRLIFEPNFTFEL
jgi:hypothetical protein